MKIITIYKNIMFTLVLSNGGQRGIERECDNGLLRWCVGVDTCTRRGGLKLCCCRSPRLFCSRLERLRGSIMQQTLGLFPLCFFPCKVLSLYTRRGETDRCGMPANFIYYTEAYANTTENIT